MYKIAICDTDKGYIRELEGIIRECNVENREINFLEYQSGHALLKGMPEDVDAVIVEVQLPGMNGNRVVEELKIKRFPGVLVQAGSSMPTPETVRIAPYRYLLKQDSDESIARDIRDVLTEMDIIKTCFTIEGSYLREKMLFKTEDIVYITHHQKGSVLHLNKEKAKSYSEGNIITPYNFKELLEMLRRVGFSIPHNSYIVNLRYVADFDMHKETFCLEGQMMSVSRSMKKLFYEDLLKYIEKRNKEKLR